jgi:hypothetical protein
MKCEHCGQTDTHTINCVVNVANENARLQDVIKRQQERIYFWHRTADHRSGKLNRLLDEIDELRQENIRWHTAAVKCAAYRADFHPETPEEYCIEQSKAVVDIIDKKNRAECERDAWIDTARTMQKNADYYRGLLEQIAKEFGDACYIDDTGKKTQDIFCCKVPGLVREMENFWSHNWRNKVEVLKEIIQRCLPSLKAHSLDMEPFDEEQQKLLSDIREVLK